MGREVEVLREWKLRVREEGEGREEEREEERE